MNQSSDTAQARTQGAHHIGLTVSDLEASAAFFTKLLGWREVRRDAGYPAVFVSDGVIMLTLWQTQDAAKARPFDRKRNVGLHHLALLVDDPARLDEIHELLNDAPNVEIEFAPESLRGGPTRHMMCLEPSGIRVEFICPLA